MALNTESVDTDTKWLQRRCKGIAKGRYIMVVVTITSVFFCHTATTGYKRWL